MACRLGTTPRRCVRGQTRFVSGGTFRPDRKRRGHSAVVSAIRRRHYFLLAALGLALQPRLVTVCGIRYAHLIVIECALYVYEKPLDESSIERPTGDIYKLTPGVVCSPEQAESPHPDWVKFQGGMMISFSDVPKVICRVDSPLRTSQLDGAGERYPWRGPDTIPSATRAQDTAVERHVVGGDERRVVDPGAEYRPQLGEGRGVAHVLPAQPVESGERKLLGRRPDQVGSHEHDPAAVAGGEADRAGAVAACGGGFEVGSRRRCAWCLDVTTVRRIG